MLCQGNLDQHQGKVREMSVNFVLSSLYEPCQGEIHPCGFSPCTFQDDGSVVVDSLFLIAPDVCGFLCLVPVFVMQYLMSFLVFFTVEERAGCFTLIVFLLSCSGTCKYVMCLPSQCRGLVYGL